MLHVCKSSITSHHPESDSRRAPLTGAWRQYRNQRSTSFSARRLRGSCCPMTVSSGSTNSARLLKTNWKLGRKHKICRQNEGAGSSLRRGCYSIITLELLETSTHGGARLEADPNPVKPAHCVHVKGVRLIKCLMAALGLNRSNALRVPFAASSTITVRRDFQPKSSAFCPVIFLSIFSPDYYLVLTYWPCSLDVFDGERNFRRHFRISDPPEDFFFLVTLKSFPALDS